MIIHIENENFQGLTLDERRDCVLTLVHALLSDNKMPNSTDSFQRKGGISIKTEDLLEYHQKPSGIWRKSQE